MPFRTYIKLVTEISHLNNIAQITFNGGADCFSSRYTTLNVPEALIQLLIAFSRFYQEKNR